MMRRTIVRYANLSFTLTLRMTSPTIQKRFPTYESLIEGGLLLDSERVILEDTEKDANSNIYWVPLVLAVSLIGRARSENYITSDRAAQVAIREITNFRSNCGGLLSYDWISIPLVYTQVNS